MLLIYTINLILDSIRMIICFTLIHFNYIYFIIIAINILKLQKKLLLISVERDSNNAPHNSQDMID